ncbi:response regulator receiver protein [Paraburkholderia diazotrophica]|uniref:response regulator receiver protein n=1 Tax=Paraburkholderia diazotrophica TaxID=667676 RepID=UPI0031804CFD
MNNPIPCASSRPSQSSVSQSRKSEIDIVPCALVFLSGGGMGSPNLHNCGRFSYLSQAVTLNRSLLAAGLPRLTIATNDVEEVLGFLSSLKAELRPAVFPITPSLEVPEGIAFYGAHFKLDLLEQVALTLADNKLLLLLDTDVIAQHGLDLNLLRRCHVAGAGAFDISDQEFFAYGAARVVADLELVAGTTLRNPRWYGGEFLIASRAFINQLIPVARECFEHYRAVTDELNHHGDEAFISAALNMLSDRGQTVIDVGAYRAVGRHWSGNTHRDLRWFRHCAFLHLPDCKPLLGRDASSRTFSGARLWRWLLVKHEVHRLVWMFRLYAKGRRRGHRIFSAKSPVSHSGRLTGQAISHAKEKRRDPRVPREADSRSKASPQ